MSPLQNCAIERPERMFYVELIVFGTLTHGAVRRTIAVLAQSAKGARRICKWRYRRSEIKRMREAGPATQPALWSASPASEANTVARA